LPQVRRAVLQAVCGQPPGLNIPSNLFHINTPQYFHRTNFPAFQVSFSKTSKAEL
jgi:hypothetical protein